MSQMSEAASARERDADIARRIEDLRVSLIRAINTALSRAGVELPASAAATVEPTPISMDERAKVMFQALGHDPLALCMRVVSLEDIRDELRARLASWPDDLRVAAIAEAEDEAKRAVAAERERDEARAKLAAETARADQNYRDLQKARANVRALEDWRADVTGAMHMGRRRPGDVQFADVPQHIRDLVRDRDRAQGELLGAEARAEWEEARADKAEKALAEATEWRPMREHIAEPTIVAWQGQGGRVGMYGACNFGPLTKHEQTQALGWLPIPPYRAKEEQ